VGVRVIVPEVVEQVIVIVMVGQTLADLIGAVAQVLLAIGATIAATVGEIGAQVAAIGDAGTLAVAAILDAALAIVGGEVAILAAVVAQVGARAGAIANAIAAIAGDGARGCARDACLSGAAGGALQEVGYGRIGAGRSIGDAGTPAGALGREIEEVIKLAGGGAAVEARPRARARAGSIGDALTRPLAG
jgi:hypothetical protein